MTERIKCIDKAGLILIKGEGKNPGRGAELVVRTRCISEIKGDHPSALSNNNNHLDLANTMNEATKRKPHLKLIKGGLLEQAEVQLVKQQRFTRVKRVLANVLRRFDTNPVSESPSGKFM